MSLDYLAAIGEPHNYLRDIDMTEKRIPDPRFQKALQTILYRQGPAIGLQANCYAGNVSFMKVAEDKAIHCFDRWSIDAVYEYTKVSLVSIEVPQ